MKKLGNLIAMAGICLLVLTFTASAQRSFTAIDVPVTENFDTLANSGSDIPITNNVTPLVGWYATRLFYTAGTGSMNAGTNWSYGSTGSTERAWGSVASNGSGDLRYGLRIQNNTGTTITALDIAFTGEQWRNAGVTATHTLLFEYSQAASFSDITSGSYIAVPSLHFDSLVGTTTAGALNGNLPANRIEKFATILVTIPPGEEIILRWTDVNDAGNDHGLAVDDLSVTPRAFNPGTVQFTLSEYSGLENDGDITVTATRTGGSGGAISVDYGEQVIIGTRNDKSRNVRPELKEAYKKWLENDVTSILADEQLTVSVKKKGEQKVSFRGIPEELWVSTGSGSWILSYGSVRFKNTDQANFIKGSCSDPECVDITEIPESFLKGPSWVELPGLFSDTPTFGDARAFERRADLRSEISDLRSKNAIGGGTATGGASCTAGVDYIMPSGTLNWADGDSADKTFNITICPDSDVEPDETFNIELTNPTGGATLGSPSTATVTILNDDFAPLIVDSGNDGSDANPGDGNCATGGGVCTLRAAVEEANALPGLQTITFALPAPLGGPAVILLASGTEIVISDDVVINGPGAEALVINAGPGDNRIFFIPNADVTLTGMTLTNGGGDGNFAGNGGAIFINDGALNVNGCVFTANSAPFDVSRGGAIAAAQTLPGAFTVNINNSTFSNNSVNVDGDVADFTRGGAIDLLSFSGVLNVSNSTFTGNSAERGGAIAATGTADIRDSTFTSNSADGDSTSLGGAVALLSGSLVIDDSTFDQNGVTGPSQSLGGAVYAFGSEVTIDDSAFTNNTAGEAFNGAGGGLFLSSAAGVPMTAEITDTTFDGNSSLGLGGGISVGIASTGDDITLTINRSSLINNSSGFFGGGLHLSTSVGIDLETTITNSTISGNSSQNGGGIYHAGSQTTLNFTTVAFNTAVVQGGGATVAGGTFALRNSIVSNNSAPTDPAISGTFTSLDYNHFHEASPFASGVFTQQFLGLEPNDVVGPDPRLAPLALNGGTTPNHRPLLSSPVIGSIPDGVNGCGTNVTSDQRGQARPNLLGCEKGSVESLAPTRAAIEVSGRVLTADGMPIRGATLTVHGGAFTEPQTFVSGSMGTFELVGLRAGETYFIYVSAGRYTFAEPWITFTALDSITDMEIIATPLF